MHNVVKSMYHNERSIAGFTILLHQCLCHSCPVLAICMFVAICTEGL